MFDRFSPDAPCREAMRPRNTVLRRSTPSPKDR